MSPIASFSAKMKGETAMARAEYEDGLRGHRLAYLRDGSLDELGDTGFFFLGGYQSDMMGSKAQAMSELAHATRRTCLRFDYSGHGQSDGAFEDGTISQWLEQATHMFLKHTRNKRIVIGSSMGGWLALLLARKLAAEDPLAFRRVGGLVLVAPATDMTHDLMWETFDATAKQDLATKGYCERPSSSVGSQPVMMSLIEDGYNHMVLKKGLSFPFPVRILQGTKDRDVPPEHAVKTMEALNMQDVAMIFVKDGDHRLSSPLNITLLKETVLRLAEKSDGIKI